MTDFDGQIERIAEQFEATEKRVRDVLFKFEDARKKTEEFLGIAQTLGITAVGIGKAGPGLGHTSWRFGGSHSIFTRVGPGEERVDGWPAAWRLSEAAGVGHSAGNTGQHQADTSGLIDGVYELRNGAWMRIDINTKEAN